MVVAEPNSLGARRSPFESNTELVIDADRPFASAVAVELVKSVAGWRLQVFHSHSSINALKTSTGRIDQVSWETLARVATFENRLRLWTFPALDRHADTLATQQPLRSASRYVLQVFCSAPRDKRNGLRPG
jgi:hypothetical protein